ncbi:MAG: transketolase family protein [Eggerthellaceae bacterium]|nr:transketolase family protein [Eggerthellaceae bacterium]
MTKPSTSADAPRKAATREALGATLIELVLEGLPVVAVDADLAGSTTLQRLADAFPEGGKRLFNTGIAEQNMIGVAAGLALAGHIAFTGSFAIFGTGRVYDQIRNTVAYSNLDVKLAPTHAGVTVGPDGGSHQMLEDLALMLAIPHMKVLVPADYESAAAAIRLAAKTPGPVYIRLGRAAVPCLYEKGSAFALGKSKLLRKGSDVSIFACGIEVSQALIAADLLALEGISAEVVDVFSLKPFDEAALLKSAARCGCVVAAEEHMRSGGLCAKVAEVLALHAPTPCEFVAVQDRFGKSGNLEELLAYCKLDAPAIVEAVKKAVARKCIW